MALDGSVISVAEDFFSEVMGVLIRLFINDIVEITH